MAEVDDALKALLSSRPAFGQSSEALDLVQLTNTHLRTGTARWLEVGAGDGRNLQFQVDRLAKNRRIVVTALEPAEPPLAVVEVHEWLSIKAEDFWTSDRFDWINVRHSGYYLHDPLSEIIRLIGMLTNDGVLALTHWSQHCVLHRLHLELCGGIGSAGCAGIEQLAACLSADARVEQISLSVHDSNLDVPRVLRDEHLSKAIFSLALRGNPARASLASDQPAAIAQLLMKFRDPSVRRNGILLLRAARP